MYTVSADIPPISPLERPIKVPKKPPTDKVTG